jgi:hypothetical protein
MLKKTKPKIGDLVPKVEVANSFEAADKKEAEHKELKASKSEEKKAGRPLQGKSKSTHKIAFYVNDETLDYLESLTNRKERTPNAVAKKLLLAHYELHSKE